MFRSCCRSSCSSQITQIDNICIRIRNHVVGLLRQWRVFGVGMVRFNQDSQGVKDCIFSVCLMNGIHHFRSGFLFRGFFVHQVWRLSRSASVHLYCNKKGTVMSKRETRHSGRSEQAQQQPKRARGCCVSEIPQLKNLMRQQCDKV